MSSILCRHLALTPLRFCFSAWNKHVGVPRSSQELSCRTILIPDVGQQLSGTISGICHYRRTGIATGETSAGRRRLLQGVLHLFHRVPQTMSTCVGVSTGCCLWTSTTTAQAECWVSENESSGLPVNSTVALSPPHLSLTHSHTHTHCWDPRRTSYWCAHIYTRTLLNPRVSHTVPKRTEGCSYPGDRSGHIRTRHLYPSDPSSLRFASVMWEQPPGDQTDTHTHTHC